MSSILLRCWNRVGGLSKALQHHKLLPGISRNCAFAEELLEKRLPNKVPDVHAAVFSVLTSPRRSSPPRASGTCSKVQGQGCV